MKERDVWADDKLMLSISERPLFYIKATINTGNFRYLSSLQATCPIISYWLEVQLFSPLIHETRSPPPFKIGADF